MRWKNVLKFFCTVLLACLSLSCFANTALTLDEAIRLSLQNQPYLRSHDANNFASTGIRFFNTDDPKLAEFKTAIEKFRYKQNVLTQDIVTFGESFLTAKQRSDLFVNKNRRVRHGAESALLSRAVARDAALAWLSLYEAQHALGFVRKLQREYLDQIVAVKISYGAGKASQSDVWKAEDAHTAALDREIELKNQLARTEAELTRWTDHKTFVLDEKIELKEVPPLAQLRQRISGHPQQQDFWLAKEIAETAINLVEDTYKPDPKIEYHPQEVIVTAMNALRDKIDFQAADSLRVLESALSSAYADWQFAQERRDLYEKSVVPNVVLRLQASIIAYGNGKTDFSSVLDARRYGFDSKIEQLRLQIAVAKARIQLGFYE